MIGTQWSCGCFSSLFCFLLTWISGFLALLPEVNITLHWNLFFKNQALAGQAKPCADGEKALEWIARVSGALWVPCSPEEDSGQHKDTEEPRHHSGSSELQIRGKDRRLIS